jgi:hypothetical protein
MFPALGAQTGDIACLPLRQDLLAKKVLITAQRDFGLGNNLSITYKGRVGIASVILG